MKVIFLDNKRSYRKYLVFSKGIFYYNRGSILLLPYSNIKGEKKYG